MPRIERPTGYRLPANDIPIDARERLHPWIAGFVGLTPEAVEQ